MLFAPVFAVFVVASLLMHFAPRTPHTAHRTLTGTRECFMQRIAAMKNVLSPSSVAIIIVQLLKNPPRKLASASESPRADGSEPNDENQPEESSGFTYAFHSASVTLPSFGARSASENVTPPLAIRRQERDRRRRGRRYIFRTNVERGLSILGRRGVRGVVAGVGG